MGFLADRARCRMASATAGFLFVCSRSHGSFGKEAGTEPKTSKTPERGGSDQFGSWVLIKDDQEGPSYGY